MNIPQTGRHPVPLPDDSIDRLLRRKNPKDQLDIFATDANVEIRTLGKLALRRSDVNDLFALGDLCARRCFTEDKGLLIFYVGKTLQAYHRAWRDSKQEEDKALAEQAVQDFVVWVCETAQLNPTRRNLAVALWAIAENEVRATPDPAEEMQIRDPAEEMQIRDLLNAYGLDSLTMPMRVPDDDLEATQEMQAYQASLDEAFDSQDSDDSDEDLVQGRGGARPDATRGAAGCGG